MFEPRPQTTPRSGALQQKSEGRKNSTKLATEHHNSIDIKSRFNATNATEDDSIRTNTNLPIVGQDLTPINRKAMANTDSKEQISTGCQSTALKGKSIHKSPISVLNKNDQSNETNAPSSSELRDVNQKTNNQGAKGRRFPHRVLIYTACYNVIDGVTLTIRKIESEILAAGGHVCILTTRSGNSSNTHLDGQHPHRRVIFLEDAVLLPFLEEGKTAEDAYYLGLSLSNRIKRKLDDFGATVVHLTVPDKVGLDIVGYARDKQIPLMGTYHSNLLEYLDHYGLFFLKPIGQRYFRHLYNFLQSLYVPTPFIQNNLKNNMNLHRCTNLRVWGRGIDLKKFNPKHRSAAFRSKFGISPTDTIICFVGRLVYEKRPDIFANVIRRLHAKGVPFKALVVGSGQYMDEMKKLPNTICTGFLRGKALSVAYASSDIFLFPGALETFGNVTLEAAASGLPLVVESGCSGHLVVDNVSGYACSNGDEDAFFKATLRLVTDKRKRQEFSTKSREHSLNFEKRTIVRQMLTNYVKTAEEFHTVYGGRHQNRDQDPKWNSPHSFRLGHLVWPFLLQAIAWCLMFIIGVVSFLIKKVKNVRGTVLHLLDCINRMFVGQFNWGFCFHFGKDATSDINNDCFKQRTTSKVIRSATHEPCEEIGWVMDLLEVILNFGEIIVRTQANIQCTIMSILDECQ